MIKEVKNLQMSFAVCTSLGLNRCTLNPKPFSQNSKLKSSFRGLVTVAASKLSLAPEVVDSNLPRAVNIFGFGLRLAEGIQMQKRESLRGEVLLRVWLQVACSDRCQALLVEFGDPGSSEFDSLGAVLDSF